MKRSFIREILEAIDENTISFAGGLPNEKVFPKKLLKKATKKSIKKDGAWQYSTSNGFATLRMQIAKHYTNKGFQTHKDEILITTGSQQALFILAKYFESKKITIEAPSYIGAINCFKLNNISIDCIPLKTNGIDTKLFKNSIKSSKLCYLIPDYQNPSTTTYTNKKRDMIAKIVQQTQSYIIEDSPYSEIFFNKEYKSISSQTSQNSFHLGSFSKTLAPALRVGWIRADKKLLDKLLPIKESLDLHTCGISQMIISEYLKENKKVQKQQNKLRKEYKIKMKYFCKCLDKYLPEFIYKKPKGGMFVYGAFDNIDSYKLLRLAMKKGVVFVPANEFYEGETNNSAVRFNFTNSSFKDIKKGIIIISKIYKIN